MKPDDFEKQLQRQSLRQPPAEWRGEIIQAARAAAAPRASRSAPHVLPWWREWLWPCPEAWAGLAAVWLLIAGLNATDPQKSAGFASQPSPAPDAQTALAAQRRELARLLDIPTAEPKPTPKSPATGPRSESASPSKV